VPSNEHGFIAYLLVNTEAQLGDARYCWAHEGEAGGPWVSWPYWHVVKGEALQLGKLSQVLLVVHKGHSDVELSQPRHGLQARHVEDGRGFKLTFKNPFVVHQLPAPVTTILEHSSWDKGSALLYPLTCMRLEQ